VVDHLQRGAGSWSSGYEKIKAMAKAMRCTIPDLLVLARQNDPFFAGAETSRAMAEWFTRLWLDFGYTTGVHLRRSHYQLVSQGDAKKLMACRTT
jgi:hypothetical protein